MDGRFQFQRGTLRGEQARLALVEIVNGGPLVCTLTGEITWKREVGYCVTADGTDIGQAIIAQGAALSCPRYDSRYLRFEQVEALAAQARASYCIRRAR